MGRVDTGQGISSTCTNRINSEHIVHVTSFYFPLTCMCCGRPLRGRLIHATRISPLSRNNTKSAPQWKPQFRKAIA